MTCRSVEVPRGAAPPGARAAGIADAVGRRDPHGAARRAGDTQGGGDEPPRAAPRLRPQHRPPRSAWLRAPASPPTVATRPSDHVKTSTNHATSAERLRKPMARRPWRSPLKPRREERGVHTPYAVDDANNLNPRCDEPIHDQIRGFHKHSCVVCKLRMPSTHLWKMLEDCDPCFNAGEDACRTCWPMDAELSQYLQQVLSCADSVSDADQAQRRGSPAILRRSSARISAKSSGPASPLSTPSRQAC